MEAEEGEIEVGVEMEEEVEEGEVEVEVEVTVEEGGVEVCELDLHPPLNRTITTQVGGSSASTHLFPWT